MKQSTRLAHAAQYVGLCLLSGGFSVVPHRFAVHSGDLLGRLARRSGRLRTDVARDNLRQAFPEAGPVEIDSILRGLFRHLGRTLAEFCRYPVLNPKKISRLVDIDGEEHLRDAVDSGRGVFLLTGHFGNWELLGAGLAARGFPMTFMVGPHRNKMAEELFNRYRALNQVEVLVTRNDLRDVFRALRRGRIVASVADQDAGPSGPFVNFFGRPASVALGPFRIARRTGSPLVFAFDVRDGIRHRIHIDAPLRPDESRDATEEATSWAGLYHQRLEALVRRHPEQWFWVHRRWRSRPPSEADALVAGLADKLDLAEL